MTSVLGRVGASRGASDRSAAPAERGLPSPARTRRPLLAVGSVAVIVASVAAFVAIYSGATHQVPVLVVVRAVAPGQQITAADLGQDGISSSGSLAAVPVSQASAVVGRLAEVPLVPGSLLLMADVTGGQPIKPGDAVVGIALKDGQLPASGLQPGDRVMVVQTEAPGSPVTSPTANPTSSGSAPTTLAAPPSGGIGSPTGVLVPDAAVSAVAPPTSGSSASETQLVSVEVSQTQAAQVSVAAAADQISLVLLPGSGVQS